MSSHKQGLASLVLRQLGALNLEMLVSGSRVWRAQSETPPKIFQIYNKQEVGAQ